MEGREEGKGDHIIQTHKFPPTGHFFYSTIIKYIPVYIKLASFDKQIPVELKGRKRKKKRKENI